MFLAIPFKLSARVCPDVSTVPELRQEHEVKLMIISTLFIKRHRKHFCNQNARASRPPLLCPERAIQRAVLDGLGDVLGLDRFSSFQVCNRSCDFEDAIMGAGGQSLLGHGAL